ncbi:MAG: hydrogenase iron-sulfur subunit [Thermodesulfobacteriota bacterium]
MSLQPGPIKLIGFLCNWCSYAGADLAGVSRFQYDASIRIVRLPCSGRMDPLLALKALQDGADGVLISGCHPGDCHYSDGNYFARRRFAVVRSLMEFVGLDPRRLQMSWVSASEGKKWAEVVNEVAGAVTAARDEARAAGQTAAAPLPAASGDRVPPREDPELTAALRQTARDLLATGRVQALLGHRRRPGGRPGTALLVATGPEALEELVAFQGDAPNLACHLKSTVERHGTTALVGKGSDLLTAINLVRENQLQRQSIVLVGLGFPEPAAGGSESLRPGRVQEAVGLTQAADLVVGARPAAVPDETFADVAAIDALPRPARYAFWREQFGSCLRCYACRSACPSCYCKTCFADSRRPAWTSPAPSAESSLYFHLIRAYHLAGRCAGCRECQRVCPMQIPLLTLARKASQVVQELFGHRVSADPQVKNPLAAFAMDDQVDFIR